MALASVSHVLPDLSKKLGLSPDLLILERAWDEEVGSLREFSRIAAIDRQTLVVEVDSAVVMQEVSLRRRELVRKLNKHFPAPFIQSITVRISQTHGR